MTKSALNQPPLFDRQIIAHILALPGWIVMAGLVADRGIIYGLGIISFIGFGVPATINLWS